MMHWRHRWSKWAMAKDANRTTVEGRKIPIMVQFRTCETCGKVQMEEMLP